VLPAWRRSVVGLIAVSAASVAVMAWGFVDSVGPSRLDALVDPALVVTSSTARQVYAAVVVLGSPTVSALLIGGIAVWAAALRRWPVAALVILGPGCAALLTEFALKPLVDRDFEGVQAFPSGHVVRAAALATVAIVVLLNARGSGPSRAAAVVAVVGLVVAVALAVVALNWHYTTDTVGGALLSVAVVLAVSLGIDQVGDRRRIPTRSVGGI
jgi:membrane-associated phospholipid phosphatase